MKDVLTARVGGAARISSSLNAVVRYRARPTGPCCGSCAPCCTRTRRFTASRTRPSASKRCCKWTTTARTSPRRIALASSAAYKPRDCLCISLSAPILVRRRRPRCSWSGSSRTRPSFRPRRGSTFSPSYCRLCPRRTVRVGRRWSMRTVRTAHRPCCRSPFALAPRRCGGAGAGGPDDARSGPVGPGGGHGAAAAGGACARGARLGAAGRRARRRGAHAGCPAGAGHRHRHRSRGGPVHRRPGRRGRRRRCDGPAQHRCLGGAADRGLRARRAGRHAACRPVAAPGAPRRRRRGVDAAAEPGARRRHRGRRSGRRRRRAAAPADPARSHAARGGAASPAAGRCQGRSGMAVGRAW